MAKLARGRRGVCEAVVLNGGGLHKRRSLGCKLRFDAATVFVNAAEMVFGAPVVLDVLTHVLWVIVPLIVTAVPMGGEIHCTTAPPAVAVSCVVPLILLVTEVAMRRVTLRVEAGIEICRARGERVLVFSSCRA